MTIKSDIPIWGRLYPDLMDREKVVAAYKQGKTQAKAAAIIGCCDRTFRRAFRYHHIKPPIYNAPDKVKDVFERNGSP